MGIQGHLWLQGWDHGYTRASLAAGWRSGEHKATGCRGGIMGTQGQLAAGRGSCVQKGQSGCRDHGYIRASGCSDHGYTRACLTAGWGHKYNDIYLQGWKHLHTRSS